MDMSFNVWIRACWSVSNCDKEHCFFFWSMWNNSVGVNKTLKESFANTYLQVDKDPSNSNRFSFIAFVSSVLIYSLSYHNSIWIARVVICKISLRDKHPFTRVSVCPFTMPTCLNMHGLLIGKTPDISNVRHTLHTF